MNTELNNTPLVSIVMPVFNAIAYLPETVASIQAQTYRNFEVISMDNLSSDGTFEYMNKISAADPRFFVKKREKKGEYGAQAIALSMPYCHGEYYFFTTHDDLFDTDFLEKCVKKALETGADIVQPHVKLYYGKGQSTILGIYPLNNDYGQVMDNKTAFYLTLDWSLPQNSLQKMSLVRKTGFSAEYYNSCEYYGRKRYLLANKIVFCDTTFYYRQNNPGAITKNLYYFSVDVLTTQIMLYELLLENNYSKKDIKHNLLFLCRMYLRYSYMFYSFILRNSKLKKEEKNHIITAITNAKKKISKYSKQERLYHGLIMINLFWVYALVKVSGSIIKRIIGRLSRVGN